MYCCVKNAKHLEAPVDLFFDSQSGKIINMTPAGKSEIPENCQIFEAEGLVLMPSFIDAHAHLREPGFEYKETIATGLEAAAHGGFSQVMCMANTNPVNDEASVTTLMLDRAKTSHPHGPKLYPIAAATKGLLGQELAPLGELKEAGCVAVSNDGRPLSSSEIMRRVMEYASDFDLTVIDHCEDPTLATGWIMNESEVSSHLGLKGQPVVGEAIQACRDIMLAEYLDLPVHIAHVSCALTVDILKFAKDRGIKVTAETCPHYLLLTDEALNGYNSTCKVSPPLRRPEDREALIAALLDGTIDILVTDHAPHTLHEKLTSLDQAKVGFSGLDLAVTLTWNLVRENRLPEDALHRLWCRRPGQIFKLPVNGFAPNDPADFFLFDPHEVWVPSAETLYSKGKNTPFLGQELTGKVKHHWIAGQPLF
ncbi:MAG: dihydroorotase [Desulfovibrionaceae bacterium]|nr:dihydroorotase [Desulfovibrionaceae bacterium]